MQIRALPKEHIETGWQIVSELAEKMGRISGGIRTAEGIKNGALNGDFSLWVLMNGDDALALLATTEGKDDSGRQFGMIVDAVGEQKDDWIDFVRDGFRDYFKGRGCHRYMIMGRKGWARDLPTFKMRTCIFEEVL